MYMYDRTACNVEDDERDSKSLNLKKRWIILGSNDDNNYVHNKLMGVGGLYR